MILNLIQLIIRSNTIQKNSMSLSNNNKKTNLKRQSNKIKSGHKKIRKLKYKNKLNYKLAPTNPAARN